MFREIKIERECNVISMSEKINVKPNSEFIEIKERIMLSFFDCIRENGKIDNPS